MPSTNSASPQLLCTIRVSILKASLSKDGHDISPPCLSFWNTSTMTSLLTEIDPVMAHGAEIGMEAAGLLCEMTEPDFPFIAQFVHRVLSLLDPPNKALQSEDTDLMTGLIVVASATACV